MTTIKTGNRRLLKLAAKLEKLPRKRFDYASIVGYGWKGAQNLSCGTTACAIGWAATMPEFRRLGLRLERDKWSTAAYVAENDVREFGGLVCFSLTQNDWRYLFQPSYDGTNYMDGSTCYNDLPATVTPKQVAKHIRKFVAAREAKLNVEGETQK